MTRTFIPGKHQQLMIEHALTHPRCGLWAGMGMGKTSGALTVIDLLRLVEEELTLVIAPLRVARDVWPQEAKKWDHLKNLRVVPLVGDLGYRLTALKELKWKSANVFTVNYEILPWLIETLGDAWPFANVIADEATKLKSYRGHLATSSKGKEFIVAAGGKRARALGKIAHTKVKRWINLTGTPSPNGLKDLWGQTWFLDAGKRLGHTYGAFKQRWFQRSFESHSIDPMPFSQEQIQDKLKDICISLRSEDYFDITKPIVNNIYVDLPAPVRAKYREMEKEMFTRIQGRDVEAFNAAARTMKCLQLANGAVYVNPSEEGDDARRQKEWKEVHDEKLTVLESIVEEAGGMPLLVSYEFKSDLARILHRFKDAVDISKTEGMRKFRDGKAILGCAHPQSMGHGIDGLQDVTNIIAFFGHNWNLELYQQIIERIGPVRQAQSGHKRPVFIYHILVRKTVDEMVMMRRDSKREVQDILMEYMRRSSDG
jgi:hypothetical protein